MAEIPAFLHMIVRSNTVAPSPFDGLPARCTCATSPGGRVSLKRAQCGPVCNPDAWAHIPRSATPGGLITFARLPWIVQALAAPGVLDGVLMVAQLLMRPGLSCSGPA